MHTTRRYGFEFDLRVCATLGENLSTRSVFEIATSAPALTGASTLVDEINRLAPEMERLPQKITLESVLDRLAAQQRTIEMPLPPEFVFVRTGDLTTARSPGYGIVAIHGFDRDALLSANHEMEAAAIPSVI